MNGRGAVAKNLSALFLPVSTTRNISLGRPANRGALSAIFAFVANVIALIGIVGHALSLLSRGRCATLASLFTIMMAHSAFFGNTAQPVGHSRVFSARTSKIFPVKTCAPPIQPRHYNSQTSGATLSPCEYLSVDPAIPATPNSLIRMAVPPVPIIPLLFFLQFLVLPILLVPLFHVMPVGMIFAFIPVVIILVSRVVHPHLHFLRFRRRSHHRTSGRKCRRQNEALRHRRAACIGVSSKPQFMPQVANCGIHLN